MESTRPSNVLELSEVTAGRLYQHSTALHRSVSFVRFTSSCIYENNTFKLNQEIHHHHHRKVKLDMLFLDTQLLHVNNLLQLLLFSFSFLIVLAWTF